MALPDDIATTYLRIDAKGGSYSFRWAAREGEWKTLAENLDGTMLSTRWGRGFVGTMIGLYAYGER